MSNVDQFESMFRAAARDVLRYELIHIRSVLVVTDLEVEEAGPYGDRVREFLKVLRAEETVRWRVVNRSEYHLPGELLDIVQDETPDLICTYRNLHSGAWKWPYSLGTHVDLLTQHTKAPVMLLPHPQAERSAGHAQENTDTVMAITDHLAGDHRLVNYASRFTEDGGALWLTHVEDEVTFSRYVDMISKIPSINTDEARQAMHDQLLKEPHDYIMGCADVLRAAGRDIHIHDLVLFGRHLSEYRRLIEEHKIDLLVLNTNDEDQLAMHGIAYALTVELRHIPLLML